MRSGRLRRLRPRRRRTRRKRPRSPEASGDRPGHGRRNRIRPRPRPNSRRHAGLVYKIRAKGTFVAPKPPDLRFIGATAGSADDLRSSGRRISTRVLGQHAGEATAAEAAALQIENAADVVRLRRVRSVDGKPWLLVDTTLPLALVPGLATAKLENRSLYEHLRRHHGIEPAGADRWIQAVLPTQEEAGLLQVTAQTPLLCIESIVWDSLGQRFEWYRALHRSEESRFYVGIR
ncbi:MAG: GntR family transcriptional regulator [Arthrobacter sp.]